jgi:hypothetical protein
MPSPYHVKLTISTPVVVKFKGRDVFRMTIVASDAVNMPSKIFGHRRTLIALDTYQDEFCFVCSAYELSIYPEDDPVSGGDPPFFRKDTIDVYLPGIVIAESFKEEVKAQVCLLSQLLVKLDDLSAVEEYWACESRPTTTTTTTTSTTTTPAP